MSSVLLYSQNLRLHVGTLPHQNRFKSDRVAPSPVRFFLVRIWIFPQLKICLKKCEITTEGINIISHVGKRKNIFKGAFKRGYVIVPRRVDLQDPAEFCYFSKTPHSTSPKTFCQQEYQNFPFGRFLVTFTPLRLRSQISHLLISRDAHGHQIVTIILERVQLQKHGKMHACHKTLGLPKKLTTREPSKIVAVLRSIGNTLFKCSKSPLPVGNGIILPFRSTD